MPVPIKSAAGSLVARDLFGLSIRAAFKRFLIGDLEVVALRDRAIEIDPSFERVLVHGWCYPDKKEWPVAYENLGVAGTISADSPVGYLARLDAPVPDEIKGATDCLASRYIELIDLLRAGELQAVGHPVRPSDLPSILPAIWEDSRFYLNAITSELLQVSDEEFSGWHNFLVTRWRAVTLQKGAGQRKRETPKAQEPNQGEIHRSNERDMEAYNQCVSHIRRILSKSRHKKTMRMKDLKERCLKRFKKLSVRGFYDAFREARVLENIPSDSEWWRRGPVSRSAKKVIRGNGA